jgi:hypothetical protein
MRDLIPAGGGEAALCACPKTWTVRRACSRHAETLRTALKAEQRFDLCALGKKKDAMKLGLMGTGTSC